MSSKSVLPERCSKGVLQQCHFSVSTQGVSQVGSLENVTNILNIYLYSLFNIRVGIRVRGLHLVPALWLFARSNGINLGSHGP